MRGKQKRVISLVMAFLMMLSLMPMNLLGGIVVKADELRTEWSFRSGSDLVNSENGVHIEKTTGTLAGLEIDATASGAKFYAKRPDWAQFNKDTIIKVPVAGACKVTVTSNGAGALEVDGKAIEGKEGSNDNCTGAGGYVTIKALKNDYIGSIVVTPNDGTATPNDGTATPDNATYAITVTNDGNGSASADVSEAKAGATVKLSATPNDGYKFEEWNVVKGDVAIKNDSFTMVKGEVEIQAVFKLIPAPVEKPNPLTTIVNDINIECEGGSYTVDNGVFTINGAGTTFGKDSGKDDFYYVYFDVPEGTQTLVAKLTPGANNSTGFIGAIAKNGVEDSDYAAGVYYNYGKNTVTIGRHGGSSGTDADMKEPVYVKLEFSKNAVYYTLSKSADFGDETAIIKPRNGMGASGLDARTVGFFATEGNELTVSDIELIANYTEDGATKATKKIVYSSKYGELIPAFSKSSDYGKEYDAKFTFESKVDGNELELISNRNGSSNKGDMRAGKTTDYLLFPVTTENWTIQADVLVKSLNTGTDKQGVAVGQFVTSESGVDCSFAQVTKNKAMQHNFGYGSTTNSGNPKSSEEMKINIEGGMTYTMSYQKTTVKLDGEEVPSGVAYMNAKDASGKVVMDGTEYPFDLTNAGGESGKMLAGKPVQYGIAVSAIDVVVTNIKIVNEDGYVIYDQNDYYIAKGVAAVVGEATAAVAEDRLSINVEWTLESEGVGNVQYVVMVSKDGGDYTMAGTSKVCNFVYTPDGDGTYAFKVYSKSGDDSSAEAAKTTNSVDLVTPLDSVKLSAVGDADGVKLSFAAVENATSYDIYRAVTSDGTYEVIKNLAAAEVEAGFTDTPDAEVPVYYYVVAKNETNTSNPSEVMQALRTAGHVGEYLVGPEADNLTITSKTNDTVFDGKFEVKGTYAVNGSYVVNVNGTAQEAVTYTAGAEAVMTGDLVDGRNDVEVIFTNEKGEKSRTTFNFVNNPVYDILVDAAYEGEAGAAVDGVPTYKSIKAALATVAADNEKQVTIFVKNGVYNERIEVKAPKVSILGEDAKETKIQFSAAIADKTATSMWDRNAMYVDSAADGFTLENIWVENTYNYTNGNDQQADAMAIAADDVIVINVSLIGYQDTLLVDSRVKDSSGNYEVTNQYFYKCYITGNVDFIYGSGSAVFEDCDVVGRYTEHKADGCFTAARTYISSAYGLVFNNCRFYGEDGINDGQYRLARPWGADAGTTFLNCYMGKLISSTGYGDMSGNSYKKARFSEFNTYGPAFAVNNDRPLLSADQAEKFATATVLGEDFEYAAIMEKMYKAPDLEGFLPAEDEEWYVYVDGEVATDVNNTLVKYEGAFFWIENGKWDKKENSFVEYDGAKFLVANGMVASGANGLMQDPLNKTDWYFVAEGQVQGQAQGIVGYDGAWFYVQNGKLDTTFTGYAEYDGGKFLVAAGRILKEVNGLAEDPQNPGDWYYVAEGQVVDYYTGLAMYDDVWFYVVNGKLDVTYTGQVEYNGAIFEVVNGSLGYGTQE